MPRPDRNTRIHLGQKCPKRGISRNISHPDETRNVSLEETSRKCKSSIFQRDVIKERNVSMFETWKSERHLKRDNLEIGSNDRLHAGDCVFKNSLEFDQLNKLGCSSPKSQKNMKL